MSVIKHLEEDYQAFRTKLNASAAHLVTEFDGLFRKLLGEAETDAADVAQEAETAAEPVEQAAEGDAGQLAKDAASDAAAAMEGGTKA